METCYRMKRRGKRLYHLLILTATVAVDQRRAYKTHRRNIHVLWFLLAQAIRESVSPIVAPYEHGANPDGREALLELGRIYGERAQGERSMQVFVLERRIRDLQCNSAGESAHLTKLDASWEEFEAFGNAKAGQRSALLLEISEALSQALVQKTIQPGMAHDERNGLS